MSEVPIELYKTENGEFVKFVRYEEYEKIQNIIKEAREYIERKRLVDIEVTNGNIKYILEILDKGSDKE